MGGDDEFSMTSEGRKEGSEVSCIMVWLEFGFTLHWRTLLGSDDTE